MKKAVPGSTNTSDMREAMEVFRHWLDVTYPEAKASLRAGGFKPLLSKKCVERFMPAIEENSAVSGKAKQFARVYVSLTKGKKLGNVLVDDSKPVEPDWERARYEALEELVPGGREGVENWSAGELWEAGRPSKDHLNLISWAWSPVAESKLLEGARARATTTRQ